ncbi:unnamed protein product [Closterium sp. NIES-54]
MALRPSSVPRRVVLPEPLTSSLPHVLDPESNLAHAASPTVNRLLAIVVTDPDLESTAAFALLTELVDFAARSPIDYVASLVTESESICPQSVWGELALSSDVLKDSLFELECLAVALPRFASMLICPEGDTDALHIPTPRSYAEAIAGVDFFQTFSPTPKTSTLWVLLHVAVRCDYEPHSLDFPQLSCRAAFTRRSGCAAHLASLGRFLRVLQRFSFQFSSPQPTPLSTGHSLSAPPSDESVEPSGPYPELVGCLLYLMTYTRPDLAYPFSLLDCYVALDRHRKVHWDAAERVLRYLCNTSGLGLVLGGQGSVVLTGHSDASWADDQATKRSSQGYTFSLGSGSVSWRSTRSSSVLSSSCEAEIYAGAMAAQELRWLTYLLTDLGERPRSPPVLYVDNKAMLALCHEQRLEHRTKHIALCYFLARELQQHRQLRLSYVASQANTADMFTKALGSGDHQHFCTALRLVPTLPHLLVA